MSPYLDRSLGRLAAALGDLRGEGNTVWWYEGYDSVKIERERRAFAINPFSDWPGWS